MGKPFSDLEKQVIAILSGGGDPLQSQNEAVRKYWEWRLNPSSTAHDLPESSTRTSGRQLDDVAIVPFSTTLGANNYAKVTISQRSMAFYDSVKGILGHQTLADTDVAFRLGKFTPAKVYARTGAAAESTARTSRITGRKYKTRYAGTDQGYSAPFGAGTANENFYNRQQLVEEEVQKLDATINLISFSPEKYIP